MTEEQAATRLDERDPVPAEEEADGQVTIDEALGEPDDEDDESEEDGEDADEGGEA